MLGKKIVELVANVPAREFKLNEYGEYVDEPIDENIPTETKKFDQEIFSRKILVIIGDDVDDHEFICKSLSTIRNSYLALTPTCYALYVTV